MDVHTRKLRYFVAVADDLHFSRAAARLFIAQQALSKQIRELEELVGTALFERTSRKVSLTPAGEAFLLQARATLAALDAGVQDAWRARDVEMITVRLGFTLGAALELTAPILAEFHEQHPESQLELREYPFTQPECGLADGATDVAFIRLPVSCADVESVALFEEPVVLAVASRHRFADRQSLKVEEMLDEPIAIARSSDRAWQSFWMLDEQRAGKPAAFDHAHEFADRRARTRRGRHRLQRYRRRRRALPQSPRRAVHPTRGRDTVDAGDRLATRRPHGSRRQIH